MSDFKDISSNTSNFKQSSLLNYCVTCANVPVVDLLLIVCNQELMRWKDVSCGYKEHQWRRLSKALTTDGDENEWKRGQVRMGPC